MRKFLIFVFFLSFTLSNAYAEVINTKIFDIDCNPNNTVRNQIDINNVLNTTLLNNTSINSNIVTHSSSDFWFHYFECVWNGSEWSKGRLRSWQSLYDVDCSNSSFNSSVFFSSDRTEIRDFRRDVDCDVLVINEPIYNTQVCDSLHLNNCINQSICESANLYWYDEKCNISPLSCSSGHLDLCLNQSDCENLGFAYWYDEICNENQATCDITHLFACNTETDCINTGGYWYLDKCNQNSAICDSDHLFACTIETCSDIGAYWYNNECNLESLSQGTTNLEALNNIETLLIAQNQILSTSSGLSGLENLENALLVNNNQNASINNELTSLNLEVQRVTQNTSFQLRMLFLTLFFFFLFLINKLLGI